MKSDDNAHRMVIKRLVLDPSSNLPIVILQREEGSELMPIWIGLFEANAIALKLETVEVPRPMTHDLIANLLAALGGRMERILITDLRDGTFYAQLEVRTEDDEIVLIDSRPSDAMALALRTDTPIYVRDEVFQQAKIAEPDSEIDEVKIRKWLEDIDPKDLGKYTM